MRKYALTLYVTGQTSRSRNAVASLRRTCEEAIPGQYDLAIVDVLESPQQAEDAKVLATPTLVRELPQPTRRIIGDLSDKDKILFRLDLAKHYLKSDQPGKARNTLKELREMEPKLKGDEELLNEAEELLSELE